MGESRWVQKVENRGCGNGVPSESLDGSYETPSTHGPGVKFERNVTHSTDTRTTEVVYIVEGTYVDEQDETQRSRVVLRTLHP